MWILTSSHWEEKWKKNQVSMVGPVRAGGIKSNALLDEPAAGKQTNPLVGLSEDSMNGFHSAVKMHAAPLCFKPKKAATRSTHAWSRTSCCMHPRMMWE